MIAKRVAFAESLLGIDARRLVFLDEMGVNLAMTPKRAWAPKGARAVATTPMRGSNLSVIAAISVDKVMSWYPFDGAVNKERCVGFLERLAAQLDDKSIVVMDNVKFHHSAEVLAVIENAGAKALFTAPYHPEFNAIEEVFSFVKHQLRKLQARSVVGMVDALATAFGRLTKRHLKAFVEHVFKQARAVQPS